MGGPFTLWKRNVYWECVWGPVPWMLRKPGRPTPPDVHDLHGPEPTCNQSINQSSQISKHSQVKFKIHIGLLSTSLRRFLLLLQEPQINKEYTLSLLCPPFIQFRHCSSSHSHMQPLLHLSSHCCVTSCSYNNAL
jgi:hypothetical protein